MQTCMNLPTVYTAVSRNNDRGAFSLLGGLTRDLKWARALETLLLESLYFFRNSTPCSVVPEKGCWKKVHTTIPKDPVGSFISRLFDFSIFEEIQKSGTIGNGRKLACATRKQQK